MLKKNCLLKYNKLFKKKQSNQESFLVESFSQLLKFKLACDWLRDTWELKPNVFSGTFEYAEVRIGFEGLMENWPTYLRKLC